MKARVFVFHMLVLLAAAILQPGYAAEDRNAGMIRPLAAASTGGKRVALLIGNSHYRYLRELGNPKHDVALMEKVLRNQLGFTTIIGGTQKGIDLDAAGMVQLLDEFGRAAAGANVTVVYYAGHGLFKKGEGEQYLPGIEYDNTPSHLSKQALGLSEISEKISELDSRHNLVFLDACREPVRGGGGFRGNLAMKHDAPRTLVLYATAAEDVADDGNTSNSPFTTALAAEIVNAGAEWHDVQLAVIDHVSRITGGMQEPRPYGSLREKLYLAGEPAVAAALDADLVAFAQLAKRLKDGDIKVLAELERNAYFQQLQKQQNLQDLPQRADHSATGGNDKAAAGAPSADRQTVALTVVQSRSEDPDERSLALAMAAYLQMSYKGVAQLGEMAKAGNIFAAMMLERAYRQGVAGVSKNSEMAHRWGALAKDITPKLERLSDQGNVIALSWLGNHWRDSEKFEEQAKAIPYFEKAADKGYSYAMRTLGWLSQNGKGVAKDEAKAVAWYRRGAMAGDALEMNDLGVMYRDGKGVTKDEAKAVEWFRKAVEAGNAEAMGYLGWMYESGKGVAKDEMKAVEWYRKGAEGGAPWVMRNLGVMYRDGKGITKDEAKAVEWFRKSAEAGNTDGMGNLGWMYETGKGVAKDEAKAVEWYRKGSEVGAPWVMRNLGVMYRDGKGVTKDEAKAVEWFRKSAEAGNAEAMGNLGWMYEFGKGVAKDEAKAVEWYRKGAEGGTPWVMRNLGLMYRDGKGVTKDEAKAVEWFRKSAEAGNAEGMESLGWMYESGKGVAKDEMKAVEWFRKAAEAGNADSMGSLGWMYASGTGVTKDEAKAAEWFRKGAEAGDADAMGRLGVMYATGKGVAKDEVKAVAWFRKAAEAGEAMAMYNLGRMYESGRGVQQDHDEAVKWYQKAAASGNELAIKRLKEINAFDPVGGALIRQ